MSKWDNDDDWFVKESRSMFRAVAGWGVLFFVLNLIFWLAIIGAIVWGLTVVL